MKKLNTLALCLALTSLIFTSPYAAAHATMKSSIPAAGSTVDVAPKEVVLTFNEKVEESFSSITVKDSAGKEVTAAKVHIEATTPETLHLNIPALTSGTYAVQWVAVGHDGHRRTGEFKFTVKR